MTDKVPVARFKSIMPRLCAPYLDNTYTIQSLDLESFSLYNSIPGNIRRVTITINGISTTLNTSRTQNDAANLYSSILNIGSSSLAGVAGNQITLSGFQTFGSYSPVFCLGEIAVTGSPVPEPSVFSLFGIGTIFVCWRFAKRFSFTFVVRQKGAGRKRIAFAAGTPILAG